MTSRGVSGTISRRERKIEGLDRGQCPTRCRCLSRGNKTRRRIHRKRAAERVLGVTALAGNLEQAICKALRGPVDRIHFEGGALPHRHWRKGRHQIAPLPERLLVAEVLHLFSSAGRTASRSANSTKPSPLQTRDSRSASTGGPAAAGNCC